MPLTKPQIISALINILDDNKKTNDLIQEILIDLNHKKPKKNHLCIRCGTTDPSQFKKNCKSKCSKCVNAESNAKEKQKDYFNNYWKQNAEHLKERRRINRRLLNEKRKAEKLEAEKQLTAITETIEEIIDNTTESDVESIIEEWGINTQCESNEMIV